MSANRISQRIAAIAESATLKVDAKAKALKAEGKDVISFAAGEPDFDAITRKIAPHIILNVTEDMLVMQEEIFGPLLPIKIYQQIYEAVTYINAHQRPLAA